MVDDDFFGYPWRYYKAVNNDNFEAYVDKYYSFWQRLIPNKYVNSIFSNILNNQKIWTRDIFASVFKNPSGKITSEEYINHSLYFEAKHFFMGYLWLKISFLWHIALKQGYPFLIMIW